MINTSRSRIIVIVTLALALVAAIIAIGLGSIYIPIPDILSTIFGSAAKAVNATIIWDIRLPRVLLAMIIGANIAVSGALLQAVMGNPLADPGLTGVTSGAAACVLVIMLAAPQYTEFIPIAAFVGGLIAAGIVYALAWRRTGISPITIILSGVAVNALCGGLIGLLTIMYSDRLPAAVQWLNGSLAAKGNNALMMVFRMPLQAGSYPFSRSARRILYV